MSIGIVGYGSYVPRHRIRLEEIAKVWGADAPAYKRGLGLREKSVPAPDQDTITMSVEAARRAIVRAGIDPVQERREVRAKLIAEQGRHLTFEKAVEQVLALKKRELDPGTYQTWAYGLEKLAVPMIGRMAVADLTPSDIVRVLTQDVTTGGQVEGRLWDVRGETANRLRRRIEFVLSWAASKGHLTGENVARWKGNLQHHLGARGGTTTHHPAVRIDDMPRWFAGVRAQGGMAARALEFIALTAARSGEVRGAVWYEIDLDRALWVIPATRMKAGRDHRVPLSPAAVAMLKALPRKDGADFVFPGQRGGQLTDAAVGKAMRLVHEADPSGGFLDAQIKRPAVPHGLRSSFRDWVAELTTYPGEMAEVALAHRVANVVEAAYRRGDMVEKRGRMMADWSGFMAGDCETKVVELRCAAGD
jgi:integrase